MGIIQGFPRPVERAVVPGGANAAGIGPVAGIDPGDDIIAVHHVSTDLVTNADVTAEATITDADEITLSTTDTTGDFVVVVWAK